MTCHHLTAAVKTTVIIYKRNVYLDWTVKLINGTLSERHHKCMNTTNVLPKILFLRIFWWPWRSLLINLLQSFFFQPSVLKQWNKHLRMVGNNCSSQNYANHYLSMWYWIPTRNRLCIHYRTKDALWRFGA